MKVRIKFFAYGLAALVLLIANVRLLFAHDWDDYHWLKKTLHLYVYGTHQDEALAAIADWDSHVSDLKLHTQFKGHTDISVSGGDWGNTGWWGLAQIWLDYDWWWRGGIFQTYIRIEHAHARYNSYYGGTTGTGAGSDVRGVFCQEIGHTFGLDHSDTGDCMGKGYYNNINITGPHNWTDIDAKY